MNNQDKADLVAKLKQAASVKMTKGEDFAYESREFSIRWSQIAELLKDVPVEAPVVAQDETLVVDEAKVTGELKEDPQTTPEPAEAPGTFPKRVEMGITPKTPENK